MNDSQNQNKGEQKTNQTKNSRKNKFFQQVETSVKAVKEISTQQKQIESNEWCLVPALEQQIQESKKQKTNHILAKATNYLFCNSKLWVLYSGRC